MSSSLIDFNKLAEIKKTEDILSDLKNIINLSQKQALRLWFFEIG